MDEDIKETARLVKEVSVEISSLLKIAGVDGSGLNTFQNEQLTFLRKKEEDLRKKDQDLRKKEEDLRKEKLILLELSTQASGKCFYFPFFVNFMNSLSFKHYYVMSLHAIHVYYCSSIYMYRQLCF